MFYSNEIFVVLVLYNIDLKYSQTYKSIIEHKGNIKLKGIIYDNSPEERNYEGAERLGNFECFHNPQNPGLSVAYNFALDNAIAHKCQWMILLDQDTYFTKSYFSSLLEIGLNNDNKIVAFMPSVLSYHNKKEFISPSKIFLGGFKTISNLNAGQQIEPISGINSGTIVNCDFFRSIGGFSLNYPLDMLDHWYFREIYRKGANVFLLNSEIYQNLSVSNEFEKNVSLLRYSNIIDVESLFFKSDSYLQYLLYKIRLMFRLKKQLRYKNKTYYKITLKKLISF